ncbi:MAG: Eco57I restriction-modification methylase domain-containing protein [Streptosporangiaceae bacterium]
MEQIGYVYEGLLSYEGFRAAETVVGLTGKEGHEDEVPLTYLEGLSAAHPGAEALAARLADLHKDSGIGSMRALTIKLRLPGGEDKAQAESRLYAVTSDHYLVQRLLPFYRIIRQDLRSDPVVILPGALYVTESKLRASSGTHYTPPDLAKEVAEGALEPLLYFPGPLQTADRSAWKRRSADEILALKIADIAMGSGAFLVAACRYLASELIEAWLSEGDPRAEKYVAEAEADSVLVLDSTADPLVIDARRQIIEHCLYGVDINPMAVEMAKLSLWLVSMDPHRPFTFLDDRLATGDSLLGITSIEQLEWMHLNPREGRKLHEGALLDFMAGVRTLLAEVSAERLGLAGISDDSIEVVNKKREILAAARAKTEELTRYANLIAGAALAGSSKRTLWLVAAKTASETATQGVIKAAEDQAQDWLATDQPDGAFDRNPLHWPLAFPEVFDSSRLNGAGFDAIIGNPPFLGGKKISGPLGSAYREYLVDAIARGCKGNADLIAYFVVRAHTLLNHGGQTGLIATNTLAQGDTREVGLDQVTTSGVTLRQAVKSAPWPSRGAVLEYCAIWTSRAQLTENAERIADGVKVRGITSSLDPESRIIGNPHGLTANREIAFIGNLVNGIGFVVGPLEAEELLSNNPRNRDVLFRYLNGEDLNSRPDCSARRWIINFGHSTLMEASAYPECLDRVRRLVKPARDMMPDSKRATRDTWWRYEKLAPGLHKAIRGLDRAIVIALVSKVVMPVIVPTGQVFSHMLGVFATGDTGILTLLSSAPHYWWAISRASTMKGDLRYTPTDVFETLARPEVTAEMRELGNRLDTFRRELMLARQAGLTATYNLVHDQACMDADIAELREIHRAIDEAVVRAYGWDDLLAAGLDHGFHETRQGPRYTIGAAVRQEILDRLLELNQERYAAEVAAGLHDKRGRKRAVEDTEGSTLF